MKMDIKINIYNKIFELKLELNKIVFYLLKIVCYK